MDAAQFFMLRYEPLHTTMTERLRADLSDAQLRARPNGQNSIVWLLWHVARAEDIGINRFAMDQREVFDEGAWTSRLGVGRREVGTAMTSDEVSDLSARVSIPALRAYWDAVGQRTVDVIRAHGATGWETPVNPALIRRVVRDEGDFGLHVEPEAVESYYAGMTRGWAVAQMALSHTWGHFFEGNVVRGMLAFTGRSAAREAVDAVSEDALDGVVNREELHRFEARHPEFRGALARLQRRLQEALVRSAAPTPDKPAPLQLLVFFLAHQAADDFFDIVLLAVHGYGFGALKLLRALYERVVTAVYLMAHPDEVKDFNDYADVHAHRLIAHAGAVNVSQWISAGQIAAIEAAYEQVKERFVKRSSWRNKDLKTLATDVGMDTLYGGAALWPTLQLHTTRVAMEARLTVSEGNLLFAHGPQHEEADHALRFAHDLIVYLLYKTNEFFGRGVETSGVVADVQRCWGGAAGRDRADAS